MSEEVVTIEKERISNVAGATIGGIAGIFIGLVNCGLLAMFNSGDVLAPTIAICIVLAITGCIIGHLVVNRVNHRRKIYLDADYISYGSLIGALTGLFVCVGYGVIELPDDVNVMYPASILTLAILGTITSGIVAFYVNDEIKELEEQKKERINTELGLEAERRKKEAELAKEQKMIKAKLAETAIKIQQIHSKTILSDEDLSVIVKAFELRENIPDETENLRRELKADEDKIYVKSLSNIKEDSLLLAITGFKVLQMIEPGNHEYTTAVARLTDPTILIEVAKANGFNYTSRYANPLRTLAGYIK
jgi:putative effector of murein hydrolase LrgA (UPF0299 family)